MSIEQGEEKVPSPLLELEADYDHHKGMYGVLLKVKSPGWEDLFKRLSGGKTTFVKRGGMEGEIYDFPVQDDKSFADLFPNGKKLLSYNGDGSVSVLLYFLRLPGIGSGVEVFIPGIFENDTIHRYAMMAAEKSVQLYKKLSPGNLKMKVWIGDWASSTK